MGTTMTPQARAVIRMVVGGTAGRVAKARTSTARFRYLFLTATVSTGCFLILAVNNGARVLLFQGEGLARLALPRADLAAPASHDAFTIRTEGCTIPALDAFDESVVKFVRRPVDVKPCPGANDTLLTNNATHIWIERDKFPHYNLSDDARLSCCYRSFYRSNAVDDIYDRHIDDRVKYDKCLKFYAVIAARHEFIRVTCKHRKRNITDQFFLYVTKKKPMANILEYEESSLFNQSAYNVIVLGIDAVSRLNFQRTMPKTVTFLRDNGAVELLGYNKVGDNTFPNLIPMLLGIKDTELKAMCLPHSRNTFDNCPFVWERFKEAGYLTALGEDSASLGTFNYQKIGFAGTPTDYYLRTFINEAENVVGNTRDVNAKLCMGDKYFYHVLLDYVEELTIALSSLKFFGFFWEVTMSHDYVHYPAAMDDNYAALLRRLAASGHLQRSVLLLLSDHGMRWGRIRATKQGRLEERLPFVHLLMPPSFRENNYLAHQNLKANSRRLTTPFDIHETLADLVNLNALADESILARSRKSYADNRGISLFLPIPKNRTCASAAIDDHWCTCHTGVKIALTSPEVRNASDYLVEHLNGLLRGHRQCARLRLEEVVEATEMQAGGGGGEAAEEASWREFMVVVRTQPGGAVLEGTVRAAPAPPGPRHALAGSVSRLNLYGDQSKCIHDYRLKLYCYCL